jgi:hypothetical protein
MHGGYANLPQHLQQQQQHSPYQLHHHLQQEQESTALARSHAAVLHHLAVLQVSFLVSLQVNMR